MAKKRKKVIRLTKERVILGDILPYETPIIFSNRHYYEFLTDNKIYIEKKEAGGEYKFHVNYDSSNKAVDLIMKKIIFNNFSNTKVDDRLETIPFKYKITHKHKEYRELTLIHPRNQIQIVNFYEAYKEIILYYSALSPYSIRKPFRIARFTNFRDRKFKELKSHSEVYDGVEEFGKEYINIKTFFTYRNYSNIHKFFESYPYHRAEKKFNCMCKFDITKCFDSIYTHTLAWAITDKISVKENLDSLKINSFGHDFDVLMQKLNNNETNGIIIGPELSRIFAEIILQKIDLIVSKKLSFEHGLYHNKEYKLFRYVDDYFLFCNDENTKELIMDLFKHELKLFNLHLNEAKFENFEKPIITSLTIAKQKISDLINKNLHFKIETDVNEETKYSIYVSSNKLITKFKTIIKESGINYKDVMNYSLACIERKGVQMKSIYLKLITENKVDRNILEKKFIYAIEELLDFTFFIYSVSPRVNTTIKICMTLMNLIKFIKNDGVLNFDSKSLIFKKLSDEINSVLKSSKNSKHVQIETLYLILILHELGREYKLNEDVLLGYFGMYKKDGKIGNSYDLNYWSITTLLFYIGNKQRYNDIKNFIKEVIKFKFENVSKQSNYSELSILLLDLLTCPYLGKDYKFELLKIFGIEEAQRKIIKLQKYWFIKWTNFDFEKELNTKRSQEVY